MPACAGSQAAAGTASSAVMGLASAPPFDERRWARAPARCTEIVVPYSRAQRPATASRTRTSLPPPPPALFALSLRREFVLHPLLDFTVGNFYCQFHESCRAQMIWFWFREFASQRGAGAVGAANEERAQSRRAAARQRPVLALKPSPPGPPPLSGRGGAPRGA